MAIDPGEKETGYATTHVFAAGSNGVAVPGVLPDSYQSLVEHGFDLSAYLTGQGVRS